MSDRCFWIEIVVGACSLFWAGVIVAALIFKGHDHEQDRPKQR